MLFHRRVPYISWKEVCYNLVQTWSYVPWNKQQLDVNYNLESENVLSYFLKDLYLLEHTNCDNGKWLSFYVMVFSSCVKSLTGA